jgi:hypothetical protein
MRKILLLIGLVSLLSLAANAGPLALGAPPASIQRSACTVSLDCICGGGTVTISCSGDVSCHVRPRALPADRLLPALSRPRVS